MWYLWDKHKNNMILGLIDYTLILSPIPVRQIQAVIPKADPYLTFAMQTCTHKILLVCKYNLYEIYVCTGKMEDTFICE